MLVKFTQPGRAVPCDVLKTSICRSSNSDSIPEGISSSGSASSSVLPPSAWSRDELENLNEEVEERREAEVGRQWRDEFENDLDGLYDYVGEATEEWKQVVNDLYALPQNEWQVRMSCCEDGWQVML
jgi:hypothetical protein